MIAELAIANWTPRWYYVMRNKTSGLQYVGQSINLYKRSYCGSGKYWVQHCKKHGGHNRLNIEIIESTWFSSKETAQHWLNTVEESNLDYFLTENKEWANRARETTEDSAFCDISREDRIKYARLGGLASVVLGRMREMGAVQGARNTVSGHIQRVQKIGCVIGGKARGKKLGEFMRDSGQLALIAKLGGKAAAKEKHSMKDIEGKSLAAVNMGKASGVTRKLKAKYCELHGIKSPGVNYINIDKDHFLEWRNTL